MRPLHIAALSLVLTAAPLHAKTAVQAPSIVAAVAAPARSPTTSSSTRGASPRRCCSSSVSSRG